MESEASDPALFVVVLVLAVASIGVWFALFDRLKFGPILPFEPRRPVPWHGASTLFPIAMVVLTIGSAIVGGSSTDGAEPASRDASARDLIEQIAVGSAMQTSLVVAFLTVVVLSSNATLTDLGLPKNSTETARDIRIGFVAWLAAIAPVYAAQLMFVLLLGPAEGHLLLNVVKEQPDPMTYIVAFLVAVVMAPLCEEPLFRIVLQGSLEKMEDCKLGWRTPPAVLIEQVPSVEAIGGEAIVVEAPPSDPTVIAVKQLPPPEPPAIGIAGLPYGWAPIIVSALLFGLAHFGYGPEPIPMFMFGVILGYIYQRTHRIVPSIVAHALFNGMSLFALWRIMSASGH